MAVGNSMACRWVKGMGGGLKKQIIRHIGKFFFDIRFHQDAGIDVRIQ
jgi:hypothetical protein